LLAERVRGGLSVRCVATSTATRMLAQSLGIVVVGLDAQPELDLAVDGADRIAPGLALVKGAGGALLYERIVAAAARRFVVIADGSKLAPTLAGAGLAVEVVPFGEPLILRRIAALGGSAHLSRGAEGSAVVTESGHHLLDCLLDLRDPERMATTLRAIPGVVDHGLFLHMADIAYVADQGRVRQLLP
jgi:ribose 5-phosphate isomerase A